MADDVKVKFGGDFSGVSNGASEAVNKAGGALSSWFNDFNKSTVASITSALALSAIFGKFTEQMATTLKTAKGIDEAFKRFGTGKSSDEFQLLARYGAEVGVSMEAVGRTMNYFAKVNDAAAKGSEQHRSVLRALKFTEDEVTSGKVSAIEVLRRMSDEYDRTGNEVLSAQRAVQLFGLQGEQLSAIYKNGRINLDEFTKSVKALDKATIESLAQTERRIERAKRTASSLFGGFVAQAGKEGSENLGEAVVLENMGQVGETGGTPEQEGRSIGSQTYGELKDDEDALRAAIAALADYEEDDWFANMDQVNAAKEAIKTIRFLQEQEKPKEQPEGPPLLQAARVMAASSLQDIGGGDVSSILSGTYQSSMLDAANKTADNTAKLVQEAGKPPVSKPNNVAK
jgi:hypothetical protein